MSSDFIPLNNVFSLFNSDIGDRLSFGKNSAPQTSSQASFDFKLQDNFKLIV